MSILFSVLLFWLTPTSALTVQVYSDWNETAKVEAYKQALQLTLDLRKAKALARLPQNSDRFLTGENVSGKGQKQRQKKVKKGQNSDLILTLGKRSKSGQSAARIATSKTTSENGQKQVRNSVVPLGNSLNSDLLLTEENVSENGQNSDLLLTEENVSESRSETMSENGQSSDITLTPQERRIWKYLQKNPTDKYATIAENLNLSASTVGRVVRSLKAKKY